MANQLGWDKTTVHKWLQPAINKGYIIIEEESKGRKPAKYKINSDKKYEDQAIFSHPNEIIHDFPEIGII